MKAPLLLSICLLSCTHARIQMEKRQFETTKAIMQRAMPEERINVCGWDLSLPRPETQSLSILEKGLFRPREDMVFYPNHEYNALLHEYTHYLNHNGLDGPVSRECMDEAMSAYSSLIGRLMEENKSLRKELRGR